MEDLKSIVNQEFVHREWHIRHCCPHCKHTIRRRAYVCSFCGYSESFFIGTIIRVCRKVECFNLPRAPFYLRWKEKPVDSYLEVAKDFGWRQEDKAGEYLAQQRQLAKGLKPAAEEKVVYAASYHEQEYRRLW